MVKPKQIVAITVLVLTAIAGAAYLRYALQQGARAAYARSEGTSLANQLSLTEPFNGRGALFVQTTSCLQEVECFELHIYWMKGGDPRLPQLLEYLANPCLYAVSHGDVARQCEKSQAYPFNTFNVRFFDPETRQCTKAWRRERGTQSLQNYPC